VSALVVRKLQRGRKRPMEQRAVIGKFGALASRRRSAATWRRDCEPPQRTRLPRFPRGGKNLRQRERRRDYCTGG